MRQGKSYHLFHVGGSGVDGAPELVMLGQNCLLISAAHARGLQGRTRDVTAHIVGPYIYAYIYACVNMRACMCESYA